ncbi:rhodanese-like domain-containing protein [Deinococcus sp. KNUC1210]|uniref:rhodanese-like domain-containing protein n=1 Tax=Deinococcus sp. KNUC1210 TaxID=2917691 RepID=UPI001EEFD2B1|nr:rhodanese-like domain-containing protein [Deinococcus sp. KNUC1210]ULH15426.1 rhodanese-like domain-containing protein [Deinococcus sp. KNUC1210]
MHPQKFVLVALLGLSSVTVAAPASGFLSPAQLQAALTARARGQQTFTLINVHIPYEGRIAGTDLLLPYDTIGQNKKLPANKKAALILYCRSGNMSAQARSTLNQLGYTNVRELQGGFDAWKDAGYPLK